MPQSQWIILLIAAMVAGAVLFRLYLVLGRRTGAERPAAGAGLRPANALSTPSTPPAVTEPGARGLLDIQLADKSFETAKFLDGARTAYGLIVRAFEKGDTAALRPLLSDEVYQAFTAAIAARGEAPAPLAFAAIKDARISNAAVEGKTMEITITFVASFDPPAGAPRDVTDIWTFARAVDAADLNWTLVATSGEPV
jgi:predicted lipid-binding transport protein (Tim44 family)